MIVVLDSDVSVLDERELDVALRLKRENGYKTAVQDNVRNQLIGSMTSQVEVEIVLENQLLPSNNISMK